MSPERMQIVWAWNKGGSHAQAYGITILGFVQLSYPGYNEARLATKGGGKEARLCFAGCVFMENRTGLVVDVTVTQATGTAEREVAIDILEHVPGTRRIMVGVDKNYDTGDFV